MKIEPISMQGGTAAPTTAAPPSFSNREKRDELAREINLRKTVYPGLIRAGRLRQEQADRQRAIMQAIWADYAVKVNSDEPDLLIDQQHESVAAPASKPIESLLDVVKGTLECIASVLDQGADSREVATVLRSLVDDTQELSQFQDSLDRMLKPLEKIEVSGGAGETAQTALPRKGSPETMEAAGGVGTNTQTVTTPESPDTPTQPAEEPGQQPTEPQPDTPEDTHRSTPSE